MAVQALLGHQLRPQVQLGDEEESSKFVQGSKFKVSAVVLNPLFLVYYFDPFSQSSTIRTDESSYPKFFSIYKTVYHFIYCLFGIRILSSIIS
jgi:hypothetical protein